MNDTSPPGEPQQTESQPQHSTAGRFFSWLRGLGVSRGNDRWFAGVAAGIAQRAGIDPIIVRGVFVVLTVLGGSGILLYLAAWLLLPDTMGNIHLEQIIRGQASTGAIVAAILIGLLVALPLLFWFLRVVISGPWGWGMGELLPDWLVVTLGVIWWALIVPAGIIWLIVWLVNGAGRKPAHRATSFAGTATGFAEQAGEQADRLGQKMSEKSREWEQWGREYQERHRLGAGFIAISLALALLAGGIAAAATFSFNSNQNHTLIVGLVAAVTVLALSMIVAGVRGRDSGWLGFLAFCGVLALVFAPFSGLLPKHTEFIPFGNTTVFAADGGSDRAVVMLGGNTTIDLGELSRSSDARTIDVWLIGGNITVLPAQSHPVRMQVNLLAGNVHDQRLDASESRQGGIFVSRSLEHNVTATTTDITTVHVRLVAGNVYFEDSQGRSGSRPDAERAREIEQLRQQLEELENAQ